MPTTKDDETRQLEIGHTICGHLDVRDIPPAEGLRHLNAQVTPRDVRFPIRELTVCTERAHVIVSEQVLQLVHGH